MTAQAFQVVHRQLERVPRAVLAPLFVLIVFLHNPNALLHAEFWGEDGLVWYSQARKSGLFSLLHPLGGYLNSLQRLPALAVQPLSLAVVPKFFVLFAIAIQALPAIFLVSDRMSIAWPGRSSRVLFALLFVMMPNAPETALTLTNSQWYLAILAFLVIVSSVPKTRLAAIGDGLVLLVSGLSGPFSVIFTPVAFFRVVRCAPPERQLRIARLFLVGATALVQAMLILGLSSQGRVTGPLGATPQLLVKILAMIPLGAEIGYTGVGTILNTPLWAGSVFPPLIVCISAVIFFTALARGPHILKEFTFFAAVMFALALSKPLISMTEPQWPKFMSQPAGNRYFLYPMLAWWGGLFVLVTARGRVFRLVAGALLAMSVLVAVPLDWGDMFKFGRTDFVARAHQFEGSQPGTVTRLDIHPPGFYMTLTQDRAPRLSPALPIDPAWIASDVQTSRLCAVDSINNEKVTAIRTYPSNTSISMVGWALSSQATKPRGVAVLLRGPHDYAFAASHGVFRDDVVASLGGGASRESGFASTASLAGLVPGTYHVELVLRTRRGFERCDTGKSVAIGQ